MNAQERLSYAIRLPETDRTRRARIDAALEDIEAEYTPVRTRFIKYVENYGLPAAAPVEPDPIEINLSMTANADNVKVTVEATR